MEKSAAPTFIRAGQQPLNRLLDNVDFANSFSDMPQFLKFLEQPENSCYVENFGFWQLN
jgi:hypothetical protein